MPSTNSPGPVLFDAGILIGALAHGDPRHPEAKQVVEAARAGRLQACTTAGILAEVYATLTWQGTQPPQSPEAAALAVRLLVAPPSGLAVLEEGLRSSGLMLELAAAHRLTARRIHDARHAAAALAAGVRRVYTYDVRDWTAFASHGLAIVGPESVMSSLPAQ